MATDPRAWLETRLDEVSPELADAIRGIVGSLRPPAAAPPGSSVGSVGESLALAAIEHLERVVSAGSDRSAALDLLAADALLTYAFEAAADLDEDVAALADRVGPRGLLGERLLQARAAGDTGTDPGEDPAEETGKETG